MHFVIILLVSGALWYGLLVHTTETIIACILFTAMVGCYFNER